MTRPRTLIVGAGVAGVTCADALRTSGEDGEILLIERDAGLPYDRPPLSKQLLEPDTTPERPLLRPAAHYDEHGLELRLGEDVVGIDPDRRRAHLASGEDLAWDRLILATGRTARPLRVAGSELSGLLALRTFDDSLGLRHALDRASFILIVGAGFIGAEIASAARRRGLDVTMVELAPQPMARVLQPELGAACAELLHTEGVDLRTGVTVRGLEGVGHVERAILSDGTILEVDLVVAGIGTEPEFPAIDSAPLTGPGIRVDRSLATTLPSVWAIGDVATSDAGGAPRVVEQWTNAVEHGRHLPLAVAEQMPFTKPIYGWSQQFGRLLQIVGDTTASDSLVSFVDDTRRLTLCGQDGTLVGAFSIDRPRELMRCRTMIAAGVAWSEAIATFEEAELPPRRQLANARVAE
jgi:NADPH-dependent 2,4-dienoyl-CoA reductase/sulfur reductase-like enzyme